MITLFAPDTRHFVAGHSGLVGSAITTALHTSGATNVITKTSRELDLRDAKAVESFLTAMRPNYVIDAAAKVGGILANSRYPADFLSDNLRIQTNLLDAAHQVGVERFLFLGSSCIYPRDAPQPIPESAFLTGPLEPTNAAYAVAKIAGITQVQAMRQQYGHRWISAMPTNLYGPGDNFHPQNSHVVPALIRRFHEATKSEHKSVTIWGTGSPRREFLHVDDLASACLFLLEHYDDDEPINVGTGSDLPVMELAHLVAEVVGFNGVITTDPSKPDGTPQKVLDTTRISELGWHPTISLEDGLRSTYEWFVTNETNVRAK